MAQRRMFSLKIIDTDLFLDMPISTQLLYFHLSMRADDDGFVSNPKKITKMVNCNEDDIKLLILKQFIIPFDSGVCVIKDWKIHNYIQKDRYTKTRYANEISHLMQDENGSYQLCIHNVSKMDTQVRLGKDRIDYLEEEAIKDDIVDSEVIKIYEDCISSKISNSELRILSELQELAGKAILIKAIALAIMKNSKNLAYVQAVISDWRKKDLKTLEQVDLYLAEWTAMNIKANENKFNKVRKIAENKDYGTKISTFNNYEQRNYDFDMLERKLLGWDDEEKNKGVDQEPYQLIIKNG